MSLQNILLENCRKLINSWQEKDIYAISFMLYSNTNNKVGTIENFPEFSVGYNTESFCENAPNISEERWNYAYWIQNNVPVISDNNDQMVQQLIEWCQDSGIKNLGTVFDDEYDENFNYMGKGPGGYYELLMLVAQIAKTLQSDGTIKSKFGNVPVIVHDLEYAWYCKVATIEANPNGEADDFIATYDKVFAEGLKLIK